MALAHAAPPACCAGGVACVKEVLRAMPPTTLVLDLEGTLVSNAVSQIARPHLRHFLERCSVLFDEVVVMTAVREGVFRQVAGTLVAAGEAPRWFRDIRYVGWDGKKSLRYATAQPDAALLVDDHEGYVADEDRACWVRIECFDPRSHSDSELLRVLAELETRARSQ